MTPRLFLLLNLALAFYNVGTIWAHEVDIFRSWKLVSAGDFHRVQAVHWRKLPYWVLAPAGVALLGAFAMLRYQVADSPPALVWCAVACQVATLALTVILWGRWQAKLARDDAGPNSQYLARILSTHWLRTSLVTIYAVVLLGWTVDAMALPSILAPTREVDKIGLDTRAQTFQIAGRVVGASGKHAVYVALWRADGFLERPVDGVRFEPGKPPAFRFVVPKGAWALSAFEDMNDNGELDMGAFGPKEPSGFWRRFTAWHRPKFDEVATQVDRDIKDADIELR
jgi:hypothetical protein